MSWGWQWGDTGWSRPQGKRNGGGDRSFWISKQIASFARYPHKRPHGLDADDSGGIRLGSLLEVWAAENAVTEHDIKTTLERYKFHEKTDFLRFSVTKTGHGEQGDVIIRVHRSSDHVRDDSPNRCDEWTTRDMAMPEALSVVHPDPEDHEDLLNTPPSLHRRHAEALRDQHSARSSRQQSRDVKVKGSLARHVGGIASTPQGEEDGDQVVTPPELSKRAAKARAERAEREEERRHSHSHSHSRQHRSRTPTNSRSSVRPRQRSGVSMAEKLRRWVRHILVSHEEEGVLITEGWAYLDDLFDLLPKVRTDLKAGDSPDDLKDMLLEADVQNRFEFDDEGRVRMRETPEDTEASMRPPAVPERKAESSRQPSPDSDKSPATLPATDVSPERPSSSRASRGGITPEARTISSRRRSSPIQPRGSVARSTRASSHREASNSDYGGASARHSRSRSRSPSCSPPSPPPPGVHRKAGYWEECDDNSTLWWYYEGPKGKWWMDEGGPVLRYTDE